MLIKNLIFVLLFVLGCFPDFGHGETLLKVKKQTGVSFIDLWNMRGYCSSNDNIVRSGLIDTTFTQGCPSKMYLVFSRSDGHRLFYVVFTESLNNSTNWLTQTPNDVARSISEASFRIHLRPDESINCFASRSSGSQPNYYFAVYHSQHDSSNYPKYYVTQIGHILPFEGEVQGNELSFVESEYLEIKASFDSTCNTAPNCQQLTEDQMKTKLNEQHTTVSPTTTPAATTTPVRETTTTTPAQTEPTSDIGTTGSGQGDTETTAPQSHTTKGDTETTALQSQTTTVDDKTTDSTQTTKGTTTSTTLCPCDCEFKQRLDLLASKSDIPIEELKKQLEPEIQSIKKNLTVDVEKLSSTKRKKISSNDSRKSAEQIGVLGAIILSVVFGFLVLIDLLSIQRYWQTFRRNCFRNS